jgi:phosphatidylinositol alpha-1,6-mannosyltransferase
MKTKKILIITKNLPPQIGGIERLTDKTIQVLSIQFQCTVIGPMESKKFVDKNCKFIGCGSNNLFLFFFECLYRSVTASLGEKFDILYAPSGLMSPIIRIIGVFTKAKRVTYIHGLDIATNNYIYKKLFVPAILSSDLIITNSRNTSNIIKEKKYNNKLIIVNPGVEIPDLRDSNDSSFKSNYSLNGKKILLTVGRLVKRKGVAEFILRALPAIVERNSDVVFIVIGEEASNAVKKDSSVRNQILSSIEMANMKNHVLMIDRVSDDDLMSAYMSSNLFIFPLIESKTDIEGFGMVAAEAGACGLNTIAFDVGGVGDAVIKNKTGVLIPPGDYVLMADKISSYLALDNNFIHRKECQGHAKIYSWERFSEQVSNVFNSI